MANIDKNENTLISKNVNGIYLSYVNGEYILFSEKDKPSSKFGKMQPPTELFDNYLTNNSQDWDNNVKLLVSAIRSKADIDNETRTEKEADAKASEIFCELIQDLHNLYDKPNPNLIAERLANINNETIIKTFQKQIADYENNKYLELKDFIKQKFISRKSGEVEIGRRSLSEYLTKRYGAILRKNIGDIYLLDGKGFSPITHDELIINLKNDFGDNFIHDNDLKNAIGYISDRREPVPNIIKFNNLLYDMDNLKEVETDEPIFTLLQVNYDFNPNAESVLFKNFLNTTFKRSTEAETEKAVKGVLQLSGYLFTSGNKYQLLPIFTGLAGAGKSTFFNIITAIFGNDKISGVSLQSLEKDSHAGSQFIKSHLNIIRDSDSGTIENNTILKNLTGNESFPVNPKYKEPIDLSAEEVPKPILVCNTMPKFKEYDDGVIRRFIIVEFEVSFKNDENKIIDLDKKIISDKKEMEWFIYNSIMTYKEMVENKEEFIFKISEEETMELINKHTHPLNHIITNLILKHDPIAYKDEREHNRAEFRPIFTNDLVDVILLYSEKSSIDVPTDKHGRINKKKLLTAIKEEFDLYDGELIFNRETEQFDIHRDYKARAERWTSPDGDSVRGKVYPNLIPTNEYKKLIREVEAERILKKHR